MQELKEVTAWETMLAYTEEAPCEHTDQVAAICRIADLCYWREGSDHIQNQAGVKTPPKLENWFRIWNFMEL